MKKLIPLILITTLGLSGVAMANSSQQGGFISGIQQTEVSVDNSNSKTISATTVEQAKQLTDDSWVVLQGNITQQVGKKTYTFKDSSGEIQVEISQKKWKGINVTPDDLVEITGKVDKGHNTVELDVKEIKIAQNSTK